MNQQLILWRHADAENISVPLTSVNYRNKAETYNLDMKRPLSDKGKSQAKKMAPWIRKHLPINTLIISSPALRATQTADALKMDYLISNGLNPETDLDNVLSVAQEYAIENLMLVGHQPWLGLLINHLLGIKDQPAANIKKSAVWWFKQASIDAQLNETFKPSSYKLLVAQHPSFL